MKTNWSLPMAKSWREFSLIVFTVECISASVTHTTLIKELDEGGLSCISGQEKG
jgi:hypothetical protein